MRVFFAGSYIVTYFRSRAFHALSSAECIGGYVNYVSIDPQRLCSRRVQETTVLCAYRRDSPSYEVSHFPAPPAFFLAVGKVTYSHIQSIHDNSKNKFIVMHLPGIFAQRFQSLMYFGFRRLKGMRAQINPKGGLQFTTRSRCIDFHSYVTYTRFSAVQIGLGSWLDPSSSSSTSGPSLKGKSPAKRKLIDNSGTEARPNGYSLSLAANAHSTVSINLRLRDSINIFQVPVYDARSMGMKFSVNPPYKGLPLLHDCELQEADIATICFTVTQYESAKYQASFLSFNLQWLALLHRNK